MRICIIASGFTGTTIPLANYLIKGGHQVDIFYPLYEGTKILDTLDLDNPVRISYSPKLLSKGNKIYNYLSQDVHIYTKWVIQERTKLVRTPLGWIQRFCNRAILAHFCKYYIVDKYDIVNVVVYPRFTIEICSALSKYSVPYFTTFHEVLKNLVSDREIIPFVEKALTFGRPIVVHSKNTLENLVSNSHTKEIEERAFVINFGPFEGYLSYGDGTKCTDKEDYILYFGNILPYKGLKYLYEAVNLLGDISNLRVVIAGKGFDETLKKMERDKRYTILNRYISNSELTYLIKHSRVVVCPYLAASQSGVVQTAMVFKKPVVASNVGAFSEVIENGKNGSLVNPKDSKGLAEQIRIFYKDDKTIDNYIVPENYQWENIVKQYDAVFSKAQQNKCCIQIAKTQ